MLFNIVIGATIFATFAMMVRDGLWSNTILLVQVILAGLLAFGFYQPLTVYIDEKTGGEYTYALDIVILWAIYAVSITLLKVICDALSKTKMKFPEAVDNAVGPLMGLLAGVVLAGIVGASLHVTPLPKDGLGGGMDYTGTSVAAAPLYRVDALWLRMVEAASSAGLGGGEKFVAQDFVDIYAARRNNYNEADVEMIRVKRAAAK
ncbi:MAG: CvpA family protein [Planctomycetota bacterium]